MPHEENMLKIFKESFVFLKPQDIVGGDFFWILKSKKKYWLRQLTALDTVFQVYLFPY